MYFPHKIQAQVGLGKNELDIPWIKFYRALDLGNIKLDPIECSKGLHLECKNTIE